MRLLTIGLSLHSLLLTAVLAIAHQSDAPGERLAKLGPAADFMLTTQDGDTLSLHDLHGKVVAVTFMFTHCADVCPLLTVKLVSIQNELGEAFGRDVHFVSVTADPERDSPAVLKRYADALGCDPAGWSHLTGSEDEIDEMARQYGVFRAKQTGGDVDHNLLTSIIDRSGTLRVQYMGERFEASEFLHDLRDLMAEDTAR